MLDGQFGQSNDPILAGVRRFGFDLEFRRRSLSFLDNHFRQNFPAFPSRRRGILDI